MSKRKKGKLYYFLFSEDAHEAGDFDLNYPSGYDIIVIDGKEVQVPEGTTQPLTQGDINNLFREKLLTLPDYEIEPFLDYRVKLYPDQGKRLRFLYGKFSAKNYFYQFPVNYDITKQVIKNKTIRTICREWVNDKLATYTNGIKQNQESQIHSINQTIAIENSVNIKLDQNPSKIEKKPTTRRKHAWTYETIFRNPDLAGKLIDKLKQQRYIKDDCTWVGVSKKRTEIVALYMALYNSDRALLKPVEVQPLGILFCEKFNVTIGGEGNISPRSLYNPPKRDLEEFSKMIESL